jgi:molybdopterin converting factor small subunit
MMLTVEFLGVSRRLAQTNQSQVALRDRASYRDLLRHISSAFPALLGPVILPDTFDLTPSFVLNVDGRRAVTDLDTPAQDGQRILLMFVEAGG